MIVLGEKAVYSSNLGKNTAERFFLQNFKICTPWRNDGIQSRQ